MRKCLVAYFSASGVTAKLATILAEVTGSDIYEIKPEVPYTKDDLNWMNKQSRSTIEMQDQSFRPTLADTNANISAYDDIFVGFPIWWYVAPTIINSFLESYDFSLKTVIPFATSDGSQLGSTVEKLRPSVSNTTILTEGALLNKAYIDNISEWVKSLSF